MPRILILSSSLLTDRVFLHTEVLSSLRAEASTTVWATSAGRAEVRELWATASARVEEFPEVFPFKGFPYNDLRRLNDFLWDFRKRPPSRLSAWRHIRRKSLKVRTRLLRVPAYGLSLLKAERLFEKRLERLLLSYQRSPEATTRLRALDPDLVVTTGPFQFEQPAVVAAARNLGIPVVALIPSWDNISTKNRLVFQYDGYLVWSEQTKRELHDYYPESRDTPVYVIGAPQFDVFFQQRFRMPRADYCASQGLRPDLPIILYAVGSPNFVKGEVHGALHLAERIARGDLGEVQLVVRPHPIHDRGELADLFRDYGPRVIVQRSADAGTRLAARTQDERQIAEWVNTFLHSDVLVNFASTVTVDAAIFDRPVVNLDFDPQPPGKDSSLIKDVNHSWTHFKPIAESGGVWLVNDFEELVRAVKGYLEHPELHREKRRWIAKYVCGYSDGCCGERMASALLEFTRLSSRG
jgi:hypothetical protein